MILTDGRHRAEMTARSNGLEQVRASIRRSAPDYDRDPSSITLVAVSKTFPAEAIEPVLAAGQRVFGENYVQEAKAKWPACASATRTWNST